MQIAIDKLVPLPLKDKLQNRPSDIWNTNRLFLPGQKVKIRAPSGTGKTTFVHLLYKLRNDYDGSIFWGDENIKAFNDDKLASFRQSRLSIIFQDMRLFEHLTARENIELNRVLEKPFYEEKMIDEMAGHLGVAHILEQKAGVCSYGEQQRIAIIRALVQQFDWLIMDEPFSHLDVDNTRKAAGLITTECAKRNAAFIITDLDDDNHFEYTHVYQM